jgi:peroxiredoxin
MAEDPDFTLTDQAGQSWNLAEHRDGAVVLCFYRGDW